MLAFLYDDADGEEWEDDADDDWRQEWHTALIGVLTTLVLGMWLLSTMAHPPGPPPPSLAPVSSPGHPDGGDTL